MGDEQHCKRIAAPKGSIRNAVLLLIIATTLLRIWGAWSIDLVIGEAYYLSSARQLHLGYFDQPPVFLWIIWATKTLFFSEAPIVLRMPFILMFSAATWMFYRLGARLHSERAGLLTAIIANVPILFTLSIGSWMQPEAPLTLLWLFAVWLLLDVLFDPEKRPTLQSWLLIGLMVGLTFMTKYHAVFLVYGTGLFVLFNKNARKWILHPGPYLAIAVAAVVSIPVVLWNVQNDMASFAFQGGRALGEEFRVEWLFRMILGQLIYITPWIAVPALWVGLRTLLKGSAGSYPKSAPTGMSFFFVMLAHGPIVLFTIVAAWSDTQFHFHWQAPGYMMLFPILGAAAAIAYEKRPKLVNGWLAVSLVLSTLLVVGLVTHTSNGWARKYLPADQGTNDPTNGALHWTELGDFFVANKVLDQPNTFVAGLLWTECGPIDNTVRGKLPVACLARDPRNIAFNIELAEHAGDTAYVVAKIHRVAGARSILEKYFERVEQLDDIVIMRNGLPAMEPLKIFKASNLQVDRNWLNMQSDQQIISLLPRTQISRISGLVRREPASTLVPLTFWLGDKQVGEAAMSGWNQEFSFELARNWAVGMRDVVFSVKSTDGSEVQFDKLNVEISN